MSGDFASRPRLFIRRCLAFAFDYLFVAFLLSVGIAALSAILPSNPTLNGGINTRVCKVLPEDAELRRYMSHFSPTYIRKSQLGSFTAQEPTFSSLRAAR